jgi:hypothetical protein
MNRAGTGRQNSSLSLGHRHDPGFGGGRLMPAFQADAQQLGTHRIAAVAQTTRDLRGAEAAGPESFEKCYVFRIPTHGMCLYADCQLQASRLRLRLLRWPAGRRLVCLLRGKDRKWVAERQMT